jgi:hypothetical protein
MNVEPGGKNVPSMHNTVIPESNPHGHGGETQKMHTFLMTICTTLSKASQKVCGLFWKSAAWGRDSWAIARSVSAKRSDLQHAAYGGCSPCKRTF